MELRDLLESIEAKVKESRISFDVANHRLCHERLVALREFLDEQPELEAGGACEADETPKGENREL